MLAALTSDTHYGYSHNTHRIHEKFWGKLAAEKIDVLFHAGDWSSYKQDQLHKSLVMVRKFFPHIPILTVLGNHCLWDTTLKLMRREEVDWQDIKISKRYRKTYGQIMLDHKQWFQETGIVHLDGSHYDLSPSVVALGFDGWYHVADPRERGTNDDKAICSTIESAPAMIYLREKAYKDLEKILNHPTEGKTVIGLTHMPPGRPDGTDGLDLSFWGAVDENHPEWSANPKYMDFLTEKCDYLLYGHTHMGIDRTYKGCRVLNCGGGYDEPKYTLFEL